MTLNFAVLREATAIEKKEKIGKDDVSILQIH